MTRSGMGTRLMMTVALLAALAGCGPIGSNLLPPSEEIIDYGRPTNFLTCAQASAGARVDSVVRPGPEVTLKAGRTELFLPQNALSAERRFVLQEDAGQIVSVTIDSAMDRRPPPPPLERSATLTIDLRRCTAEELDTTWWVWRMNPVVPDSSQKLRTTINSQHARAVIDSTSKFMIAN